MSQPNTEQTDLRETRITDLQVFANLNITKSKVDLFDATQKIYERQDRAKLAKVCFYVSIGLSVIGAGFVALSIVLALLTQIPMTYAITLSTIILEGVFFFGFKQVMKHFYPVKE